MFELFDDVVFPARIVLFIFVSGNCLVCSCQVFSNFSICRSSRFCYLAYIFFRVVPGCFMYSECLEILGGSTHKITLDLWELFNLSDMEKRTYLVVAIFVNLKGCFNSKQTQDRFFFIYIKID